MICRHVQAAILFCITFFACVPITSAQWLTYPANPELRKGRHIVLVSGDEEYRSEEALPMLAKILSRHHGFDCTVLFAQDPDHPGIADPNDQGNIPGLSTLGHADLMILFTRFRALPDSQMQHFRTYLEAGKPVFAIRTSTHAFRFRDPENSWSHWGNGYKGVKKDWHGGFGRKILGASWHSHHGKHKHQSTRGVFPTGSSRHPVLTGIEDGAIWGPTDVYGIPLPLPEGARTILLGQVVQRTGDFDESDLQYGMRETDRVPATTDPANPGKGNPNDPMMPIVWTKPYKMDAGKTGIALTSTIGASVDLLDPDLRRLFVNSAYFLLSLDIPGKANADLVGTYQPSRYMFHDDAYWDARKVRIEMLK